MLVDIKPHLLEPMVAAKFIHINFVASKITVPYEMTRQSGDPGANDSSHTDAND